MEVKVVSQDAQESNQVKDTREIYMCPLYVNFQKNRILRRPNEHDGQLISLIPVPIESRKPGFWQKRAVCMLCYTDDINQ